MSKFRTLNDLPTPAELLESVEQFQKSVLTLQQVQAGIPERLELVSSQFESLLEIQRESIDQLGLDLAKKSTAAILPVLQDVRTAATLTPALAPEIQALPGLMQQVVSQQSAQTKQLKAILARPAPQSNRGLIWAAVVGSVLSALLAAAALTLHWQSANDASSYSVLLSKSTAQERAAIQGIQARQVRK